MADQELTKPSEEPNGSVAVAAAAPAATATDAAAPPSDAPEHEGIEGVVHLFIHLPGRQSKIELMVSTHDQVHEVRQSIMDHDVAFEYTCFHLEHNGARINDFSTLSEIPNLSHEATLHLVPDPYTEKDARLHLIRIRELIGAAGDRSDAGQGILAGLSILDNLDDVAEKARSAPATDAVQSYDFAAPASLATLVPKPSPPSPKTVKAITLSPWNPPPCHLRQRGHLLYLIVTTLEGEQFQITSHVGGYYVNKSSNTKFDPAPRSAHPKAHAAHSLLSLITTLSESFAAKFAELQAYTKRKDAFSTFQITHAIPATPWVVPPPPNTTWSHGPDPTRSQESYLISGIENADTLRDWNEEIQSAKELPKDTIQDRLFRERLVCKLYADFIDAATRGAALVARGEIAPLNPTECTDAQIFVYNNVFFTFGADGVGTFTAEGGDEAARVATGKDVAGVRLVNQLDIDGLYTPATVVVDYLGRRIVGQSIIPGIFKQRDPGEHQLDYGAVEGPEVVASDERFVPVFQQLSRALKVKKHAVWDKQGRRVDLEGSVETKGLMGTDGRKYVLDLYRITPLDIPWLEETKDADAAYPHRMTVLRPELIDAYARHKARLWLEEHKPEAMPEEAKPEAAKPEEAKKEGQEVKKEQGEKVNGDKTAAAAAAAAATAKTNGGAKKPAEAKAGGEQDSSSEEESEEESDEEESEDSEESEEEEEEEEEEKKNAAATKKSVPTKNTAETEKASDSKEASDPKEAVEPEEIPRLALNPDVFSGQVPQTDAEKAEMHDDEQAVRQACAYLRDNAIPDLLRDLQESDVSFPMDGASLSRLLHKRGINVRYLGRVATLCEEDPRLACMRLVCVQDMIARSFKHIAAGYLRRLPLPLTVACVAHLLNCLLGASASPVVELDADLKDLYHDTELGFAKLTPAALRQAITQDVAQRFRYALKPEWAGDVKHLQLLRQVALQLGVQLAAKEYNFSTAPTTNGDSSAAATAATAAAAAAADKSSKPSKRKKKSGAGAVSLSQETRDETAPYSQSTFSVHDVLNVAPTVKHACPRSALAEEALEAGRLSIAQDQQKLGQELLYESLSLHEQIYGILHPEVARVYGTLSMLYYQLDEKEAAVDLARKAIIVAERTFGLDSAETLLNYLNLSLFLHANGDSKAALVYSRHALELWKIIYSPSHPDCITTVNNAAVMLQQVQAFHESRVWFDEALRICEAVHGAQSIHAATILFQLAQALALDHDSKGAVRRMRESYTIFHHELGADDKNTKEAEAWLEQLTHNAVSIAKQAKDLGRRGALKFSAGAVPAAGAAGAEQGAAAAAAAAGGGPRRIDSRSIDELIRFIEGSEAQTKSGKPRGRGNPKRRGGGVSA